LSQALPLFEQALTGLEKRKYQHSSASGILSGACSAYEEADQFDQAEIWRRKWREELKQREGTESPGYFKESFSLGINLIHQKKYSDAEPILRESLQLGEKLVPKKQAAAWEAASIKSMLGEALMGQKKYTETETLLLAGYEGLKGNAKAIPEAGRYENMSEAIQRLIDLYKITNKPEDVKKWQGEKAKYRPLAPRPREVR
jgi:hypothetical protein